MAQLPLHLLSLNQIIASSLKQLIKKGRGNWPCEALATLLEYSSERRCQLQFLFVLRQVQYDKSRDKSEIDFEFCLMSPYSKLILTIWLSFFSAHTLPAGSCFTRIKNIRSMKNQLLHLFTKQVMINSSAITCSMPAIFRCCCMC